MVGKNRHLTDRSETLSWMRMQNADVRMHGNTIYTGANAKADASSAWSMWRSYQLGETKQSYRKANQARGLQI
jgi:hypothetical protein